jgi:RecA-family ATPase
LAPDADLGALQQSIEDMSASISPESALAGLDLVALASREPDPPAMVMPGIPAGCATLIAAHGGAGKSTIALFQAVCLAAGVDFFGIEIRGRRKVLYLSCEDRENVLHWRLSRICAHLGIAMESLAGWLHLIDMVGRDCVMWQGERGGGGSIMPAYRQVSALVRKVGVEVLYVDGISDTFSGNENDRGHAKQYVNALLGMVPTTGALVLIGHVPKSTTRGVDSEGYSGSTGWHNSVRARWFLRPEAERGQDDGEARQTSALLLELQKGNHGSAISMRFAWDESAHLFLGEVIEAPSRFDRAHRDREERRGILLAIRGSQKAEVPVPAASSGPRTAYHVLSVRPEFPGTLRGGGANTLRFRRQIEQLRQMQLVADCRYRRINRHETVAICLTTEGERQCAEYD